MNHQLTPQRRSFTMPSGQLDFRRTCRTCMSESSELLDIFGNELDRKLREALNFEIRRNDGLPEQICITCVLEINRTLIFRRQCAFCESQLREYLQQSIMLSGLSAASRQSSLAPPPPPLLTPSLLPPPPLVQHEPPRRNTDIVKLEPDPNDELEFVAEEPILMTSDGGYKQQSDEPMFAERRSSRAGTQKVARQSTSGGASRHHVCPKCKAVFSQEPSLTMHLQSNSCGQSLQCLVCNYFYTTEKSLRFHVFRHLGRTNNALVKPDELESLMPHGLSAEARDFLYEIATDKICPRCKVTFPSRHLLTNHVCEKPPQRPTRAELNLRPISNSGPAVNGAEQSSARQRQKEAPPPPPPPAEVMDPTLSVINDLEQTLEQSQSEMLTPVDKSGTKPIGFRCNDCNIVFSKNLSLISHHANGWCGTMQYSQCPKCHFHVRTSNYVKHCRDSNCKDLFTAEELADIVEKYTPRRVPQASFIEVNTSLFQCNLCGGYFGKRYSAEVHVQGRCSDGFRCADCNFIYATTKSLRGHSCKAVRHDDRHDEDESAEMTPRQPRKRFKAESAGSNVIKIDSVTSLADGEEPPEERDSEEDASTTKEQKAWPCEHCDAVYFKRRSLYTHFYRNHRDGLIAAQNAAAAAAEAEDEHDENYTSPVEDENAEGTAEPNNEESLMEQSKDFPQVDNYVCTECGNPYMHRKSLYWHMRRKHQIAISVGRGALSWLCDQCQIVFYTQELYDTHIASGHAKPPGFGGVGSGGEVGDDAADEAEAMEQDIEATDESGVGLTNGESSASVASADQPLLQELLRKDSQKSLEQEDEPNDENHSTPLENGGDDDLDDDEDMPEEEGEEGEEEEEPEPDNANLEDNTVAAAAAIDEAAISPVTSLGEPIEA